MPADSDADVPVLPARFRPYGVRVAAILFGGLLVGTVIVVWLTLPADAQRSFTLGQRATVTGMILAALSICHMLARCRIDVEEQGVSVVNAYRTHRYEWGQVVAVTLRPGQPWATLDLSDGTTQSALGIQGSDGARARRQTRRLRALIDAHAATEPPAG
jgi:hypothetical protein